MKKILVEFVVETNSSEEEIIKAVEKGIYYGLDIKNVAMPKNIKNIEIRTYNI